MSDEATLASYQALTHMLVRPLLGETGYEIKGRVKDGKIELLVDAESSLRGRLIGRGGRIARSLRALIQTAGYSTEYTVSFDIVD